MIYGPSIPLAFTSDTENDRTTYDYQRVSTTPAPIASEIDDSAEILADAQFMERLRVSIKQADAGETESFDKVVEELGL